MRKYGIQNVDKTTNSQSVLFEVVESIPNFDTSGYWCENKSAT